MIHYFNKRKSTKNKGFTLIELLVVCVIFFILAAIIIPNVLKKIDLKNRKELKPLALQQNRTQAEKINPARKEMQKAGVLPVIEKGKMDISLSLEHHRIGMEVYTRYLADYKGEFVVAASQNGREVRLDFPFPEGTTEARNVSLVFESKGEKYEPKNVLFDKKGILWIGKLPADENLNAIVTFNSLGREKFIYNLPDSNRLGSMDINVNIRGDSSFIIPDNALQPTSLEKRQVTWNFNNLVTDRAVVVEFPGAESPVGRIMLLCKLVGMAVLLFGAGFWYLGELYKPGLLHNFRWGHFMLLALTYSLFFLILAILSFRGQASIVTAVAISAVLSLPLLMLHVSRIVDLNFALTRILPLSLFTLGLVLNGVYGGSARDIVFVGSAFFVVAFITITFKKWSSNREDWLIKQGEGLKDRLEKLRQTFDESGELAGRIPMMLKKIDEKQFPEAKRDILDIRKNLYHYIKEYEEIGTRLDGLLKQKNTSRLRETYSPLKDRIFILEEYFPQTLISLKTEVEKYLGKRETGQGSRVRKTAVKGSPYYRAGEKTAKTGAAEGKPDLSAGTGSEKERIKLSDDSELVKEEPGLEETYCLSCGELFPKTQYCPHCGKKSPLTFTCQKCNKTITVPAYLVTENNPLGEVYCVRCGERVD